MLKLCLEILCMIIVKCIAVCVTTTAVPSLSVSDIASYIRTYIHEWPNTAPELEIK